jgi:hypothetical protein
MKHEEILPNRILSIASVSSRYYQAAKQFHGVGLRTFFNLGYDIVGKRGITSDSEGAFLSSSELQSILYILQV